LYVFDDPWGIRSSADELNDLRTRIENPRHGCVHTKGVLSRARALVSCGVDMVVRIRVAEMCCRLVLQCSVAERMAA